MVYWFSQIVGSLSIGLLLDNQRLSRRTRAFVAWGVLFILVMIVHAWSFIYQKNYTRESARSNRFKMDMTHPDYGVHLTLYILCGLMDSSWQTTSYWFIGAMSNDATKLAHFVGFCTSTCRNLIERAGS